MGMKGDRILNWEGQKKIEMGIRPKLGKKRLNKHFPRWKCSSEINLEKNRIFHLIIAPS
jgi:hypothetical protein